MNIATALVAAVISVMLQSTLSVDVQAIYIGSRSDVWPGGHENRQQVSVLRDLWATKHKKHRLQRLQYMYRKYKRPQTRYHAPRSRYVPSSRRYQRPVIHLPFGKWRQGPRKRLAQRYRRPQPVISLNRRPLRRRRRIPVLKKLIKCIWNQITAPQLTTFLENVLQVYERTPAHTIRDISTSSIRYCQRCSYRGCRPDRHEINTTFTLAPTDGCDWRKKCGCAIRPGSTKIECKANGTIPYGKRKVTNLVLVCDGVSIVNDDTTEVVVREKTTAEPEIDVNTTANTSSGTRKVDTRSGEDAVIVKSSTEPEPEEELNEKDGIVPAPLLQMDLQKK